MPNSEYQELKECLQDQGKKIDRLLAWAEGDPALGTPSIKQQLQNIETEVVNNRRRTYENRAQIGKVERDAGDNRKDINGIKKASGAAGTLGGGMVVGVWEMIRSIFG